jgi:hypothetical protein
MYANDVRAALALWLCAGLLNNRCGLRDIAAAQAGLCQFVGNGCSLLGRVAEYSLAGSALAAVVALRSTATAAAGVCGSVNSEAAEISACAAAS